LNKILLLNYSLSVWLSRGKKDLFKNGTWYILASEIFFLNTALGLFVLSKIDYKVSNNILVFLYIIIWTFSFYGTKKWILNMLNNIEKVYSTIKHKKTIAVIGLLIYILSFGGFFIIAVLAFQGYLIK